MSKNQQYQQQQHNRCKNCSLRRQQNFDLSEQNLTKNSCNLNLINNSNINNNNNNNNSNSITTSPSSASLNDDKHLQSANSSNFLNQINDKLLLNIKNEPSNLNEHMNKGKSLFTSSCIVDRLGFLVVNEHLADVHFIVGCDSDINNPKERIPAHKLILSIGSPVFNAMFYGTGQQMIELNKDEIEIPDIEANAFKLLLRYLYTDEICIEADTVMSVLYAAKKYSVNSLERECVNFLKNNIRPDNAFMLLTQAILFDETHLADLCLQIIDKNALEAFSSEYFIEIDLDLLICVLKRESLAIKEAKLFNFVIKWAQNQCHKQNLPLTRENIQNILGCAVGYIRFPLMTREEFAVAVSSLETRVIRDDQIIDLFLNYTLNNPKRQLEFNEMPRSGNSAREQVINRFCQVESRWGYSGTSDRLRFSVDKRIFVTGLGLYGSIYGPCEYQVLIQIIHFETCTICAQNNTTFNCDGSSSTFHVLFKEPVEIEPKTDYVVAATLKGPDSYYGTKGNRSVTHESSNGNKVTFQFQYASGNNNGSSVEDGQLPEILFLYSCD